MYSNNNISFDLLFFFLLFLKKKLLNLLIKKGLFQIVEFVDMFTIQKMLKLIQIKLNVKDVEKVLEDVIIIVFAINVNA